MVISVLMNTTKAYILEQDKVCTLYTFQWYGLGIKVEKMLLF